MPDAIAPYNFVPLADHIVEGEESPAWNSYNSERHTGWFDVEYTTLTPTYTRAANEPGVEGQSPDFFHLFDKDKTPVLPGSSIRGMIRSVFEVITCSKLTSVSKETLSYRFIKSERDELSRYYGSLGTVPGTFDTNRLVAGHLTGPDNDLKLKVARLHAHPDGKGFVVVPADDPGIIALTKARSDQNWARYRHKHPLYARQRVSVLLTGQPESLLYPPMKMSVPSVQVVSHSTSNAIKGDVIFPGQDIGPRAWYQIILSGDESTSITTYDIPTEVYKRYKIWGRSAHGKKFENFNPPREAPRYLNSGEPAFALLGEDGKVSIIGANMMLTIPYRRSIKDVAYPKHLRRGKPDFSQTVFGSVDEDNSVNAIKGRVAFEDANIIGSKENLWITPKSRLVQSLSPKPTSIQTYLVQHDKNRNPLEEMRHWDSDNVKIRGFKRYWHRSNEAALHALRVKGPQIEASECEIWPLKAGITFKGRIRFTNLKSSELAALYATVQLPSELSHKFGLGKNLGLGSIDVQIVSTRLINPLERYKSFDQAKSFRTHTETEEILQGGHRELVSQLPADRDTKEHRTKLWQGKRMWALAALLSQQKPLPDDLTRQIPVDAGENQWLYRDLLPEAIHLAEDAHVDLPADLVEIKLSQLLASSEGKFEEGVSKELRTNQIIKAVRTKDRDTLILLDETGHATSIKFKNTSVMLCQEGEIIEFRIEIVEKGKIVKATKLRVL